MTPAENRQLIAAAFEDVAKGDSRRWWDLVADDFVFTIMGGRWAGTVRGKDKVVEAIFKPLREQLADRITQQAINIVADGDQVVVEARGCATTRRGELYNNQYCLVLRMEGGRVKSLKEYADTALVDRVLDPPARAAVQPA